MRLKKYLPAIIAAVFFLSLPSLLYSQDVQADQLSLQQMSLSSQVRSALLYSREQMNLAEKHSDSLQMRIDELVMQSEQDKAELMSLSMHLTDTMSSFRSLSAEFNNLSLQLVREQTITRILMMLAGIVILGKIVGFLLVFTFKLPVPKWLKLLL